MLVRIMSKLTLVSRAMSLLINLQEQARQSFKPSQRGASSPTSVILNFSSSVNVQSPSRVCECLKVPQVAREDLLIV